MNAPQRSNTAEDSQSLWALTIPPAVWLVHFLLSYAGAALWCGAVGRNAVLGPVAIGFVVITVLALIGIVAAGWGGWRRYRHVGESRGVIPSHHKDTPEDRHRFLGLATMLLAALSAIATLYMAVALAVIGDCS